MAQIEVYGIGSNRFSAQLTGLQTSGITYTRKCQWIVYEASSYNTISSVIEYIAPGEPEGASHTFSGLSANTDYVVSCTVYNYDTGAYLNSFSEDVTTIGGGSGGGGGNEKTWSLLQGSTLHVYTNTDSTDIELQDNTLFMIGVYFEYSGTAHFKAWSDTDINGYITYDTSWGDDGTPTNIKKSSGNGADGWLDISFTVTAGGWYYFWVRGQTGTEAGEVFIDVTAPWNVNGSSYGTPTGAKSETISLNPLTLYWRKVVFSKSGTVTFSTTGSVDTRGWLSSSSDCESGTPNTDYILAENDDYNGTNFSITYDVVAGQTYYIFFRAYDAVESGITILNISDVTEKISIKKWSWSASNGSNASATVTSNSYYALSKGTKTSNFSHLVWMDMVDKVWEIIRATTNWWDSSHASLSDTKNLPQNSDGLYELTAVAFNSLRNNIELIGNQSNVLGYKTGIGKVEAQNTDYPVKAQYFLTLANYINSCIDNL